MGKRTYRLEKTEDGYLNINEDYPSPPKYTFTEKQLFVHKINNLTARKKYIIQKEIPIIKYEERLFDIRAIVQKNIAGAWTVSTVCSRMAYPYLYNTSFYEYVKDEAKTMRQLEDFHQLFGINYSSMLNKASLETATLLDQKLGLLGEISVDFGLDQNGKLWIIEVNGKPQKSIFNDIDGTSYRDIVNRRPLEYAYYLSKIGRVSHLPHGM
jgi:hypothetical protein